MDNGIVAALLPGIALGGVLALAGAWSLLARGADLPHLGVGALAGALALAAARVPLLPRPVVALLVVVLGAGLATLLAFIDRRGRRVRGGSSLLPDLAVLAAVVAAASLLRPVTAIPLPFGPLGGQPGVLAALAAGILGAGGALGLSSPAVRRLRPVLRWSVAGALLGATVALAGGAASPSAAAFGSIVGLPDTVGLALRAAAVAFAARRGVADAVAAGMVLGIAELVLLRLVPLTGAALLPAVVALGIGAALHVRGLRVRAA